MASSLEVKASVVALGAVGLLGRGMGAAQLRVVGGIARRIVTQAPTNR